MLSKSRISTTACWRARRSGRANQFISSVQYALFEGDELALSRCLKRGRLRQTPRFSDRPCTHCLPGGHGPASMSSNLCCGAVGLGWDEEVSDGGEDRHEMLQRADRWETLSHSLPFSERQMIILCPVVQALMSAVFHVRHDLALGRPVERNLSVIIRFGGMRCFFGSYVSRRLAALVLWRVCTISSSTYPS